MEVADKRDQKNNGRKSDECFQFRVHFVRPVGVPIRHAKILKGCSFVVEHVLRIIWMREWWNGAQEIKLEL